jgi:hypothetical protein
MEKKSEALNKLKSKIELLDKKIRGLFESKKNIELEIQNKNIEIEDLKKEFDKDLFEFSLNLNEKIGEAKKEKNNLENSLFEIDRTIYGIYGEKPEGLYWKQVRLIHQYKKSAVGNDKLFNELQEESIERNLNELTNKIKMKLKQNNLFLNDEMKLIDLCLKVIETAISLREKSFYDKKDRDEIYDIAINTVLSQEEKIPDEEKRNDIEEKVNDKVIQTELPDVQNVSVNIRYDKVKELVSKLSIDITKKVTKVKKIGNQKWEYTEGNIFLKIHKDLGNNLTLKQKNVVIKYIQKYRTELLENKSNNKS